MAVVMHLCLKDPIEPKNIAVVDLRLWWHTQVCQLVASLCSRA